MRRAFLKACISLSRPIPYSLNLVPRALFPTSTSKAEICPGSILLAKICQQTFFAIVAKEIIEKNYVRKSLTNITKIARIYNRCNKNQDLKKRSQERPRSVRKYRKNRKSNKDFSCQLKIPMTNIAKIAKITNVTKFQTQKAKKPRRAPKCSQMSQKSQK